MLEKSEKGKNEKENSPKFDFSPVRSNEPRFAAHLDPDSSPKKGGAGAGEGAGAGNQLLTSF